ncbi:MAG TPA: Fur family transcriptional regulator [Solirubrobacteraceae bacterium]|jgi:Fur family ferric uptake transcriptional regulator/Fur family peroxide stress response transcriptional regulator
MTATQLDAVLVDKLRERGQRVTSQRLVIHRALCAREQHLTAEQVLGEVSKRLPGISLPTVYATLELFERLGLIRRVAGGGGALLFDSRVTPHAHAVCRQCGAIADVEFSGASEQARRLAGEAGFTAETVELLIWGRCGACRSEA